jgi:hypothetical protein
VWDHDEVRPLRHIILFKLYPQADPEEVLHRLRSLASEPGLLEWRIERSLDERKGIVIVQDSLFTSRAALDTFRVAPAHVEVAAFLSQRADWLVADYET